MTAIVKHLRSDSQHGQLDTQPKDFAWIRPAVRLGESAKHLKSGRGRMKGETELTLQELQETEQAMYLARRIEADPQLDEPLWRTRSVVAKMQIQRDARDTRQKTHNEQRASKAESLMKATQMRRESCVNLKQAEQKLADELKAANAERARLQEENSLIHKRLQEAENQLQSKLHKRGTNGVMVTTQCLTPRSEVSTACSHQLTSSMSVSSLTPRSNAPAFAGYPTLLGQVSQMHLSQGGLPSNKLVHVLLPKTTSA